MKKFYIERVEYYDVEIDDNDVAHDVLLSEYWIYDARTQEPITRFNYDWQALKYCRENDIENSNRY